MRPGIVSLPFPRRPSVVASLMAIILGQSVFLPPRVLAHDHRPPRAFLQLPDRVQERAPFRFRWLNERPTCHVGLKNRERRFPPAAKTGAVSSALVFMHPQRPEDLDLIGWRLVGAGGGPFGPSEPLQYRLSRYEDARGAVGWKATFDNPVVGHLLVQARGIWPEGEGCEQPQLAYWTFHLEVVL